MSTPDTGRWVIVGVITFVIASIVALILFSMGLIVHESVIWPTATLATSIIAALVASLTSRWIVRPKKDVDVNAVAARSLVWALLPAAVILLFPLLVGSLRLVWWIALVVTYTTAFAVSLTRRHRNTTSGRPLFISAMWLAGTVAGVIAVVFVASLFGLTGA